MKKRIIAIVIIALVLGLGLVLTLNVSDKKEENIQETTTTETSTSNSTTTTSTEIVQTQTTTLKKTKTKKKKATKKKTTKKKTYSKVKTSSKEAYYNYAREQGSYNDEQMSCLINLWNRESGWNPNSRNKSSGACGIPQAYPCSKIKKQQGSNDWKAQIRWGIGYINSVYGSPCKAWKHFQKKHWY